jgi:DNA-binding CsgD family transcriptional regulator
MSSVSGSNVQYRHTSSPGNSGASPADLVATSEAVTERVDMARDSVGSNRKNSDVADAGATWRSGARSPFAEDGALGRTELEIVLEILNRLGCGGAIVNSAGNPTALNRVLAEMLELDWSNRASNNDILLSGAQARLRGPLSLLRDPRTSWVPWEQSADHPVMVMRLGSKRQDGCAVVVFVDIRTALQPTPATLQRMFGLTLAESKLAAGMAAGHTPKEMAEQLSVSMSTVRSQLGAIFGKTQTHRQAELVSLLARISIFS